MVDTTIRVKQETLEKLKNIGSKGETYDDIINKKVKLMDVGTRLLKELKQLEAETDDPKVLKSIDSIRELLKR